MIIDKQPLPDDPTPSEAPPSYETLGSLPHDYRPEKSGVGRGESVASSSSSVPPLRSDNSPPLKSPRSTTSSNKGKGRATTWFNFSSSKTTREVQTTVRGLVRDLIQQHIADADTAAASILRSCADACADNHVSLSDLLQEKSIEGHTPLYWAIVKRLPDDHQDVEAGQCPDLLTSIISFATPLKPETITEVRLACLATSDQKLFQRLRLSPEFAPVSGVNQMLLGGTIPPDEIEVEDVSSDGGAFVMSFVVPHFHKRMSVSKEVELEFIARSRMWRLAFFIAPESPYRGSDPRAGSWCISLSLIENSPPTFLDSQLLIDEAKTDPPDSASLKEPSSPPRSGFRLPASPIQPKPKSTITLRLKSNEQLEVAGRYNSGKNIVISLEDSLMGANLQYGNNPYIGSDEKLRGRLEARLGKPERDDECVIC
ncbi:unnamed protein product [Cyclocybe aegerita]|uniref:Uncharacterized protein n=1 Tax=Cyclocybe aegerita TaxID=1973307 RepID=A0A8S0XQK1_CYCAE|nr:unnamed protein product [Cyclocybe aegerita]